MKVQKKTKINLHTMMWAISILISTIKMWIALHKNMGRLDKDYMLP